MSRKQSDWYNRLSKEEQEAESKNFISAIEARNILPPIIKITGRRKYNREIFYEIDAPWLDNNKPNLLKEKVIEAINDHIDIENTYTYELVRDKRSFSVGTISLPDFEEWTEENVNDLADSIIDVLQANFYIGEKNE